MKMLQKNNNQNTHIKGRRFFLPFMCKEVEFWQKDIKNVQKK